MSARFQLVKANQPDQVLGEIVFTPAGGDDPALGTTEYLPKPEGQLLMVMVQELVTGTDFSVFLDGELRTGPHDRDLFQLQGALLQIPHQFPQVRILGLSEPIDEQPGVVDPAVEAVKEIVRARFSVAWEALPAAEQSKWEEGIKAILDPVSRVGREMQLETAFAQSMQVIAKRHEDEAFLDFVQGVMHQLAADGREPLLSRALKDFAASYFEWRVGPPKITH